LTHQKSTIPITVTNDTDTYATAADASETTAPLDIDLLTLPSALQPSSSSSSPDSSRKTSFGRENSFKRDEPYKKQKENYLSEKKRITQDMLTIMRDETIIVMADWLKIRASLKNWIKLYVIIKPGILLLFKSVNMNKSGQWVGTILLNSCQLIERPSKKHGFCFKIFHPLERSIWASKGPAGETYINMPYMLLPTFYLIFRAPSESIGKIWMEAIQTTITISGQLLIPPIPSVSKLNESFRSTLSVASTTTTTTTAAAAVTPTTPSLAHTSKSSQKSASNLHLACEETNNNLNNKSDSDKNNESSDEICSLNSSNENLDDVSCYEDGFGGAQAIVDQIFQSEKSDANLNLIE
jgi:hypothetical protein